MTEKDIYKILVQTVGYHNTTHYLWNLTDSLPKDKVNQDYYSMVHYPKMRKLLESLPWISIKDRLPDEHGRYLTLADCNEHEVCENDFKIIEGHPWWSWTNKHIIYWMPIPRYKDIEINWKPSLPFEWKDGGYPL